jgi:carbonic anhydrase
LGFADDEHEFSYDPAAENGPDGWGEIKPEWATCSDGRQQSPVDLYQHRAIRHDLGHLNYSYKPAEASIVNRGHDIMVNFNGDAGSLVIHGTVYHLKQLHWHSPTEHAFGRGRRFAMELHMVHQTPEKKTAVVGILYRVSNTIADPFLRRLEPAIKRLGDGREEPIGKVNPNDIGLTGSSYYRYTGSLTTPPCAEGIIWTVIPTVCTISFVLPGWLSFHWVLCLGWRPQHQAFKLFVCIVQLRLVTLYQLDLLRKAVDDVRVSILLLL